MTQGIARGVPPALVRVGVFAGRGVHFPGSAALQSSVRFPRWQENHAPHRHSVVSRTPVPSSTVRLQRGCAALGPRPRRGRARVRLFVGRGGARARYVAVHNAMTAMGLAQTGAINEGSLDEGGEARLEVELAGGECYTFMALGGRGTEDMGVQVLSEGGDELGRDLTHDRQAAAQACPTRDGVYQVVVTMTEGSGEYLLTSGRALRPSPAAAVAAVCARAAAAAPGPAARPWRSRWARPCVATPPARPRPCRAAASPAAARRSTSTRSSSPSAPWWTSRSSRRSTARSTS
jgi:hypothetical protein